MKRTDEEFGRFIVRHPEAWTIFESVAFKLVEKGYKILSPQMCMELIRWETDFRDEGQQFKLNDHYKPYFSRMWNEAHPDLPQFKTRALKHESGAQ